MSIIIWVARTLLITASRLLGCIAMPSRLFEGQAQLASYLVAMTQSYSPLAHCEHLCMDVSHASPGLGQCMLVLELTSSSG